MFLNGEILWNIKQISMRLIIEILLLLEKF